MSQSQSPSEFFVDRSLGRRQLPTALRAAGWILRTHAEVYAERDESVEDVEWLEFCGLQGLVVLSKDRRIRYRRAEISAIRRFKVRAFVITSGNLTAADQAARFVANRTAIESASEGGGPLVYAVEATRIVKVFPA